MTDQAFIKRSTTEGVFRALLDDAAKLLDAYGADKSVIPALRKNQQALEASLVKCKVANDKYFEVLMDGWILILQKRYNEIVDRIEPLIASQTKPETCEWKFEPKVSNLRLEKIKMHFELFDLQLAYYF